MRELAKDALLGGVIILLPIAMLVFFAKWLYVLVSGWLMPITQVFMSAGFPSVVADITALLIILAVFASVGFAVRTRFGRWFWDSVDQVLLQRTPFYKTIKEIVRYAFGADDAGIFTKSKVARVQIFGPDVPTTQTALVTSVHADGTHTVFVPTGPNPTSGLIYHVPANCVQILDKASVEEMMRSIIACGAGSDRLFDAGRSKPTPNPVRNP